MFDSSGTRVQKGAGPCGDRVCGSEATKVRKVSQHRIGLSWALTNIEITRYVSSPNTNDKVPDCDEFKISSSLYTQCLDDILWEFTYLCCFRPNHVAATAGVANGERIRHWFQDKKAGWYVVLADLQMPVTSTLLDQAHNAIERKLFAMKGFHHPGGSQQAFLTGLAHLYNLVPYQRRAQHAGPCGVEVEGGRVPTADWFLNLQILTSGGFR
jgi:hypothetical protein